MDSLHVERIDHGVRTATDGDLVARIARDGIALTVCPLSNHRLQVVRDVADLPVRQLFDAGVKVTLNSDDPAYFGGYIGDNYIAMARTGMSLDELATIAEYSLKSSFATPEQKTTYANALADWKRIHL